MVDALQLWCRYAGASIRAQMQYRLSFALGALGQLLVTGIEFLAVLALFARFGPLRDWSLAEVALFYGAAHCAFALADLLASGFDQAGQLIRRGDLDRLLLRPRSTALQLLGYELSLRRLGRLLQGALVLAWALWQLRNDPAAPLAVGPNLLFLPAAILATACLFLGLFALQATLSIWTVQTLELINASTYGGVTAAQYPMAIYARWFRWLLIAVVPLMAALYWPLLQVLGKPDPLGFPAWLGLVSPLIGPLFLAGALGTWAWGVRAYTSTGS